MAIIILEYYVKLFKANRSFYRVFPAQLSIITYFTLPTLCEALHNVSKTTTTHNLGTALARQGKKVLMLDIDPQSNLTMCMGYQNPDELPCTMAHIIKGLVDETFTLSKEDYILNSEGCDLIPSSIQLSGIEPSLVNAMSRENILKKFLNQIKDEYDVVLLDCMPSLGMLTINALTAATSVLIPV